MPRQDDQTPMNLDGMEYHAISGINVAEWHEEEDGKGKPTAVLLMFDMEAADGELHNPPKFICRLKSRRATDNLIVALMAHSKAVWPDDV